MKQSIDAFAALNVRTTVGSGTRFPFLMIAALAGGAGNIAGADEPCEPYWDSAFGQPGMNSSVNSLAVFDDGFGPALYAGGQFNMAGGVSATRIAKWDGRSWSALGSGVNGVNYPWVEAMTVFDDGSGPALYVGGGFTTAGDVEVSYIAKWDGQSWSALGSGVSGSPYGSRVGAMTQFDDGTGSGPALYVGGEFPLAGEVSVNNIARWDGEAWSALDSGVGGVVQALAVFDDGSGPALYAGGSFLTAGGVSAIRIAKWDGQSWSALGSGMGGGEVLALSVFDDGSGSGPALYAGGWFTTAGGVSANRIAKWHGCPTVPECEPADLNCDSVVDGADLLILLSAWGKCADPTPGNCPADLNGDETVDGADLLILLANWG